MTAESVGVSRFAGAELDARLAVRDFVGSTRAVVSQGRARECLNREAAAFGEIVWAVVADRGLTDAGGLEPLLEDFAPERVPLIGLVNEDPDTDGVEELWRTAQTHNAAGVIVVGGGSALCAGKAVAIRLTNDGPLSAYNGRDRLRAMPAPCIAIPTTAGSGSDVSEVVILHQRDGSENLIIRGRGYAPRVSILDGELIATLPPRPMVLAAVDALSHAYESLWSIGATSFTDAFAFASARTIRRTLAPSLAGDPAAQQELIEASAMANYACGNAELGAVHALAAAPTVHIPHGRQTGVLVLHVAEWLAPSLRPEVAEEIRQIRPFYESVSFAPQFTADEANADDRQAMIHTAIPHPLLGNDPIGPSLDDLREIVARACQR